jgi:subtilase family serine protease
MSLGLRAACGAALLSLLAVPVSALETDHAALSPAAQRAVSSAALPSMSAVRNFTVIPASRTTADLKALEAYFATYGFTVRESPNLKHLILTGTLAAAANAAHTSFSAFTSNGETIVRAKPFAFPAAIARLIEATSFVPGAHARPLSVRPALVAMGPANGYGPKDIASIYDIASVYSSGNVGAGVTVAVAACGSVSVADLTHYDETFGLPTMNYRAIPVDGSTTAQDGEATLDVERVHGTAPGAAVRVYLAPDCAFSEIVDVFAQIAEDDATYHFAAVSHSYGFNEGDYAADGLSQSLLDESAALGEIAAQGTPVFVASGDGGSWNDLGIENATDVGYPASDASAIAVGGTTVEAGAIGTRLFEHAWAGSGGGVSNIFTVPSYQASTPGLASGSYKNLPDVSMLADPYTGATEVFALGGGTFPIGGTSVAAPTFAGVWALVASARVAAGAAPLKSPAAAIYDHRGDFVDVTAGDNGFYVAKPGYDNVTGLGVPDVAKLVNALK